MLATAQASSVLHHVLDVTLIHGLPRTAVTQMSRASRNDSVLRTCPGGSIRGAAVSRADADRRPGRPDPVASTSTGPIEVRA